MATEYDYLCHICVQFFVSTGVPAPVCPKCHDDVVELVTKEQMSQIDLSALRDFNLGYQNEEDDEDAEDEKEFKAEHFPEVEVTQAQFDDGLSCHICLLEYVLGEKVRQISCDHMFHEECLRTWLQDSSKCPYCRESIEEDHQSQHSSDEEEDDEDEKEGERKNEMIVINDDTKNCSPEFHSSTQSPQSI